MKTTQSHVFRVKPDTELGQALKEALGESIGYRIIGIPQRKITEDTIDAVVRLIHQ